MEKSLQKILICALIVLLAVTSFFFIANMASSPETHKNTTASIEEKIDTVLKLSAASTASSALISAIPDDTATPIAEKLADFTEYFLFILCVLYSEKYLMAIIGAGTFKVLIPLACAIAIVAVCAESEPMKRLASKIAVFGVCLFIIVPISIRVSDMIYDSYETRIEDVIVSAEELSDETAEITAEKSESGVSGVLSKLGKTVSGLVNKASELLNDFVEAMAVMIVTSCVIPVLVLLFFVWLIKILTGAEISVPKPPRPGRRKKIHTPGL